MGLEIGGRIVVYFRMRRAGYRRFGPLRKLHYGVWWLFTLGSSLAPKYRSVIETDKYGREWICYL